MQTPFTVQTDSYTYTVVKAGRTDYSALITGSVADEIFGNFYDPGFAVQTSRIDLGTKAIDTGLYALTGYPGQAFPQVTPTNYQVNLVLSAPGFRDFPVQVAIGPATTFPMALPVVKMRRFPVRIQGRIVSDATSAPVIGALVLSVDNPAAPPHSFATALRSPLYFAHLSGVSVQQVNFTSAAITPAPTLAATAMDGATSLSLSERTGLAAGSVIRLANSSTVTSQTQVEYGIVDHLGPGAAGSAGEVFLRNALNRTYLASNATTVDFGTMAAGGTATALTTDANAGDGVLIASAILNVTTVAVDSGSAITEYHEVGALSDGNGYYAFDGIGRVATIFLQATQAASTLTQEWFVEYDQPLNTVDFRLP